MSKDTDSTRNPSVQQPGRATRHENDPALQRRLTLSAPDFDDHAFVHARCRDEMLSRLDLLAISPRRIADIGAATGSASAALAAHFPGATVFAVERNRALLARRAWRRRFPFRQPRVTPIAASMDALPFADDSIDLAFCNLALVRYGEPDAALRDINRVLKPGGAFVFSTVGPDTLRELRTAWAEDHHVASFTDMHDIGDALGRAGFAEPVLDVEQFSAEYADIAGLWRDLASAGARNSLATRRRSLTGKQRFTAMTRRMRGAGGSIPVNVEVVYGQCWGSAARQTTGDVRIDVTAIGRR